MLKLNDFVRYINRYKPLRHPLQPLSGLLTTPFEDGFVASPIQSNGLNTLTPVALKSRTL